MCYTVPLTSAIITTLIYRRNKNLKIWWLNLMLYGGALFGIIDHLWNRELFLISDNTIKDLLLGVIITISIFAAWAVIIVFTKKSLVLDKK